MHQWHRRKYVPTVAVGAAALLIGVAIGGATQAEPKVVTKTDTTTKLKTRTEVQEVTPDSCVQVITWQTKQSNFYIDTFAKETKIVGRYIDSQNPTEISNWWDEITPKIKKSTDETNTMIPIIQDCLGKAVN